MPNGWVYSLSIGDWRDAEGVSFEDIGLIPDIATGIYFLYVSSAKGKKLLYKVLKE
ncbi:MAG: hypothetical protein AAFR87_29885 [Bacteroidota bacterium]